MFPKPHAALIALSAPLIAALPVASQAAENPFDSLLAGTEVSAWAAGSYMHRLKESSDANLGTGYFSHPDANTFSLDQAWLSIDKAATEDSRAGFHLDYTYGKIAEQQGGNEDSGLIYSGWVSYLAPIGEGVEIKAGRLTTLLGAEVLETNANYNITRGAVYGLQPITHSGVIASTTIGDTGVAFGVVNDLYSDTFDDDSSQKVVTGQLSWDIEGTYVGVSAIYGQDNSQGCAPSADCQLGVYDLLVSRDISDAFSAWLNVDYLATNGDDLAETGSALGIAAAGRYAFSDTTGFALRVERITAEEDFLIADDDLEYWTITGTLDHKLTPDLMIRAEGRFDKSDEVANLGFADGDGTLTEDKQFTAMVEVIYQLGGF